MVEARAGGGIRVGRAVLCSACSAREPKRINEPVSGGILLYYAIWWEGKTVQINVGRKFWQKP
jgi:hypothetical protein